ncbi:hypothetical protein [Thalassoglobus polymorphus]|nr:hypothetical protein [Thalassoglobus polymorphus]
MATDVITTNTYDSTNRMVTAEDFNGIITCTYDVSGMMSVPEAIWLS